MTNKPPAIIGVRIDADGSFWRSINSSRLTYSHLKTYECVNKNSEKRLTKWYSIIVASKCRWATTSSTFNATHQIPIETAAQIGWCANVLKRIHADDVNDRTHDTRRIFDDSFKQRLKPLLIALTVTVEKSQNICLGCVGSTHSWTHQTFAFLVSNYSNFVYFS